MNITEVTDKVLERRFITVADRIYADDTAWIKPLDKDIISVFDPAQNKLFKKGAVCIRWILNNEHGADIGRIAAFVNPQYKQEQPTGGIGFFECIDNAKAAALLLDTARKWLEQQGMEAMDGPINFGERERWWGLLVEGFHPPLYCMNYNKPYYQQLLEQYGFQPYFHQLCYALDVHVKLHDKFYQRHAEIAHDKNFRAVHIRKEKLHQFASDFTQIYNKAWAKHGGGKQLEEKIVQKMFASMKPAMDEKLIWYVYYKEVPIAMWINLPDLNFYFRRFNGKFGLMEKLRFLWMKRFAANNRFIGLVFGIVPEFQGKGIDAFIIVEAAKLIQSSTSYKDFEMQWIGDFNPKMVNIAESLGTHRSRKLTTYRYLFDRTKPFERHPMLT